jgi:hypothetical protein
MLESLAAVAIGVVAATYAVIKLQKPKIEHAKRDLEDDKANAGSKAANASAASCGFPEVSFDALTVYERYLARAKEIVSGAPYWKFIDNEDFARLTVDGAEATLSWLDISSECSGSWETGSINVSFPNTLLTLPEKVFHVWKAEERAKYNKREEDRVRAARMEANEWEAYAARKRRFG